MNKLYFNNCDLYSWFIDIAVFKSSSSDLGVLRGETWVGITLVHRLAHWNLFVSSYWLAGLDTLSCVNWHRLSSWLTLLSSLLLLQTQNHVLMESDLLLHWSSLGLFLHETLVRPAPDYVLFRLSWCARCSGNLGFLVVWSCHLDRLVQRIGVRADIVDIRLLHLHLFLHLNLLVSSLSHDGRCSSSFGNAGFADDDCENCSSDDHAPSENFVVSDSLHSSLLSLLFGKVTSELSVYFIAKVPSVISTSTGWGRFSGLFLWWCPSEPGRGWF